MKTAMTPAQTIVVGAVCLGGLMLSGCERRLFDIALQLRRAEGLDAAVQVPSFLPNDADDLEVAFNLQYVDDLGGSDGVDPQLTDRLPFSDAATSARFEFIALRKADDVPLALGRTGFLALPDDGTTLPVPMLLATLTVGLVETLPPALGTGACASADEAGRVFLVGGSASGQTGYVFGDTFKIDGLSDGDAFDGVTDPGCSAFAGSVVVVGGCAGIIPADTLIDTDGTDTVEVRVPVGFEPCGARAVKSLDDYWVIASDGLYLMDANGSILGSSPSVGVAVDAEANADGNAVVLVGTQALLLRRDDRGSPATSLGNADRIGRRFNDVAVLRGSSLLLLAGEQLVELRNDVDVGAGVDAVSFTVLSDDTVVATTGAALRISRRGVATVTRSVPLPRSHVSALPGDTVILTGGDTAGVDAIALQ